MKTKDVPALIMLLAGGVYCLFGILKQVPLMDFTVQLLIVLFVFWIFGGIAKIVLDKYMGEVKDKSKEEEAEEDSEESEDEESEESEEDSEESKDGKPSEDE